MRFILKQKFISFGNDFSVFDEHGNKAFYFDAKVLTLTRKIVVLSPANQEVAVIKRKFFSFRPTYVVRQQGQELARIFKKLFSFRKTFVIDVPGPNDITVVGQVLEHNYQFVRNGQQIAEVSKKWFRGQDTYGVDVGSTGDALLILCCAVVIDMLCHPLRDSGFRTSKS